MRLELAEVQDESWSCGDESEENIVVELSQYLTIDVSANSNTFV
jgi:hypothetical protein